LNLVNLNAGFTPKSRGFLKNSSSFDFDALNVALNDARLIDLQNQKSNRYQHVHMHIVTLMLPA